MARYEQSYAGERRTVGLRLQLTPTERQQLEIAAQQSGISLSEHVRNLCLYRSDAGVVAGTRRNPDAKGLMFELSAIGNNLNQLARRANQHDEMPEKADLLFAIELLKAAIARVIAL